ncbi:MAG TPA: M3 family oligoendopeptidase [Thermomicrobiales bacterium]|nr:M3 family oligoendopeptidase [Thermomicrobiales bacterium]
MSAQATTPVPTPDQFRDATWEEILPFYRDLVNRPLDPADTPTIEAWLDDWNALDVALSEAASMANVATSCDSENPEKEAAHLRFSSEIGPQRAQQVVLLANKLLDTGYTRPDLETTLRRFRTDRDLFREENIPLQREVANLNNEYNKICGSMTVEWDGEEIPIPRLNPFLQNPDRDIRERAWRLQFQPYIDKRDTLAGIFDKQLETRQQIARNAGFANYRDYVFEDKYRYDYTPEDCFAFHDAVEKTFVPALSRIHDRRKKRMGLDRLRPWDLAGDPEGRPALRPYESIDELTAKATEIFAKVDPALGQQFGIMREEGLLDLESRKGKRPGGFCTSFPYRKRPFIFMNAAGVGSDVRTLLHESGHAFHGFASSNLPFVYQRIYGSEMAEVASMSMELLAAPYLRERDGGYYNEADYSRARIEHLEGIVSLLTWVATVDAFQQWLYTDPAAADRDARDRKWVETWARFDPDTDWTGLAPQRVARWYKQLHIFLYPFYYIEYAIAQLGALQVWRNALQDQAKAVADYRAALALGGSVPLPERFGTAGARLIFDEAGMAELIALIEHELDSLA